MSKANSRILYLTGLGVCLWATIPLIFGLVGSIFTTTYVANRIIMTVTSLGIPVLFWLAIAMYIVGGITAFVGYVGALVKLAQLEQWIWFILLLAFSGITMLVYIFVGPETPSVPLPPPYAQRSLWSSR